MTSKLVWIGLGVTLVFVTASHAGPTGTVIDSFNDTTTPFTQNLQNRWQPVGGSIWSAPRETGKSWASGGGMWEVSTRYGRGFKMVVTPEMTQPEGGKLALIADIDHLINQKAFLGSVQVWSGKFMFPARGNPSGFPRNYSSFNTLWEFHTEGPVVPMQIGIDTAGRRNNVYFKSMGRQVDARSKVRYNRWYSWRIVVRWSYGSYGLAKFWLEGRKLASWTGPTLPKGEHPYLQFGFYSDVQNRNEVWHAAVRKS